MFLPLRAGGPSRAQVSETDTGRHWRQERDALVEIAAILTRPIEFNRKFALMLEVLAHTANADMAGLRTIDESGPSLRLIASYAPIESSAMAKSDFNLPLSNADCPNASAVRDGVAVVIGDSRKLKNPLPDYYSPLSLSLLNCPVQAGNKVVGVLGLSSRTTNNFGSETVQLMTAITSTLGVLMENASLQEERILGDEKNARLAQALEFTDDAIALVDSDGNLEYMNRAAREMTGEAVNESATQFSDLLDPDDEETEASPGILLQALDGGWSGEITRFDQSGEQVDISLSTNPVMGADKRVMGLIAVGRNVTERRKMERILLNLNLEREVEANIGRIVSSPLGIADVFSRFANELSRLIQFTRISINSVDLQRKEYCTPFVFGDVLSPFVGASVKPAQGSLTWIVAQSGASEIVNRGSPEFESADYRNLQWFWDAGYNSILGVPLKFGELVVGVMVLARPDSLFTEEDLPLVERVGSMLSGAMANYDLNIEKDKAIVEAKESETRFRQIAENIRGGFWLTDLRPFNVLYVSPSIEEIWGVPLAAFYHAPMTWMSLIHPDDRERMDNAVGRAYETGELYEEFRIIKHDGSVRWISNRGFPIHHENGELSRIGGFVEDVTERKEADLRLAEAERMASIGELSAGVAHEINNPLTSIVLYSQMLLDEDLPESIRNDLQVVSSQAYRAAKIVRNLLQFARKSDPEKRPLSIGGLIRRSVEMKSHEFNVNNITVVEDVPGDLPLIMLDEHLIIQVLLNVLTNAEQACVSTHGRGEITISVATVADMIRVSIRDDGPGILAEQLAKVFEPFYTTKEVGFGTGLGLSVSMGIISQHEGKIWVESTLGAGTTFHIDLPVTAAVVPLLPQDSNDSTATARRSTNHILVVDDEPDLRTILAKQLELRRFNVDLADGGEEAWRKLQSLEYDCILLDLRMPGMSGQELYLRVKLAKPELADRIIFITGDTVNPDTREFLINVTNPVLSKPFDFRELEQLVVAVTNRPQDDENLLSKQADSGLPTLN